MNWKAVRRTLLPVVGLSLGTYFVLPAAWPWIIATVIGYYALLALSTFVTQRTEQRRQKRRRRASLAMLQITDDEIRYSRDNRHQTITWDGIAFILFAESSWEFGTENEWVLSQGDGKAVEIPATPELTDVLLKACAVQLPGFDTVICEGIWHEKGYLWLKDANPEIVQCWRRNAGESHTLAGEDV